MTEREKLERIFDGWGLEQYIPFNTERAMLADYLLANGVIVPPCKVGDTVFAISDIKKEIYKCRVSSLEFTTHDKVAVLDRILESIVLQRIRGVYLDDFGKTVFLSREEAEAALKGGAET